MIIRLIVYGGQKKITLTGMVLLVNLVAILTTLGLESNIDPWVCEKIFVGHIKGVYSVAYFPDGAKIVTASEDGSVRIWNLETKKEMSILYSTARMPIREVAVSADGSSILAATDASEVLLWGMSEGEAHDKKRLRASVRERFQYSIAEANCLYLSASFSPDGAYIVGGAFQGTVDVWGALSGQLTGRWFGSNGTLRCVQYSPEGSRIVSSGDDRVARVWDVKSKEMLTELVGHRSCVTSASFSPDGRRIVTSSWDGTTRIWEANNGTTLVLFGQNDSWAIWARFSPDGRKIVTANSDGTARVWDSVSGREMAVLAGHAKAVMSAAFSPTGEEIVTASWDNTARLWRLRRPEGWRGIAFHPLAFCSLACVILLILNGWYRRRLGRKALAQQAGGQGAEGGPETGTSPEARKLSEW